MVLVLTLAADRRGRDEKGNIRQLSEMDEYVRTQDVEGLAILAASCKHFGLELKLISSHLVSVQVKTTTPRAHWSKSAFPKMETVLGADEPFGGFGCKILQPLRFLQEALEQRSLEPTTLVVFTDAFDTFFGAPAAEVERKFRAFSPGTVLFSAERWCWPAENHHLADKFPTSPTPYRYLNSGGYLGQAKDVVEILHAANARMEHDDQGLLQRLFLSQPLQCAARMVLDYHTVLLQTHAGEDLHEGVEALQWAGDRWHNRITETAPCLFHANGGLLMKAKAKRVMERMPWWSAVPSTLESMQGEGVRRDAPNTCSQPVSSSTQGVRQTCANCQQQESEVDTFPRCSRCKVVYYCSSQCQRQAWTAHAPTCTPAATDG